MLNASPLLGMLSDTGFLIRLNKAARLFHAGESTYQNSPANDPIYSEINKQRLEPISQLL